MLTTKPFDQYRLRIYGSTKGRAAIILCYQGALFAGRIDFFPDQSPLPEDFLTRFAGELVVVLNMPMSQFEAVLSTIRQESPLALTINVKVDIPTDPKTYGIGYLTTHGSEPVGEEEGIA